MKKNTPTFNRFFTSWVQIVQHKITDDAEKENEF